MGFRETISWKRLSWPSVQEGRVGKRGWLAPAVSESVLGGNSWVDGGPEEVGWEKRGEGEKWWFSKRGLNHLTRFGWRSRQR